MIRRRLQIRWGHMHNASEHGAVENSCRAGQGNAKRSVQGEDGRKIVANLPLREKPDGPRMAFDED